MNEWLIAAVVVIVAALVAWAVVARGRGAAGAQSAALEQQLQAVVAEQRQINTQLATQVTKLVQSVAEQLGGVQNALREGAERSGQLVSQTQESMRKELESSRQMLGQIHRQLGEVQQAGRQLSEASETIERVLGAAQRRGSLGEIALERLLADALPQAHYELQYRFASGEAVDAVVRFRGKLLPIDSKFPLESYQRLAAEGEEARRSFAQAVRAHADSIAKKYVLPGESTLDIAFMFVPSEGVYYELLMSETSQGLRLDEYCRKKSVIPVSPNTLYAYLSVILMGLQGMQIEENARHLLGTLGGLVKQFDVFAEDFRLLGTHLRNASSKYEDAHGRLEHARAALEQTAQGALPAADGTEAEKDEQAMEKGV